MPDYRLYRIDRRGHVLGPAAETTQPDDVAMVAHARKSLGRNDIEIWQGLRLVAYLTPDDRGKTERLRKG
jgi:hypothetical protein